MCIYMCKWWRRCETTYVNVREVTSIPYNHTYAPHLHIRRRKPARRVAFYIFIQLSLFLSFFSPPSWLPSLHLVARASWWTNEHTISHPCSRPLPLFSPCASVGLPPPLLETVFHIQNVPRIAVSYPIHRPLASRPTPAHRDSWASVLAYLWKEYKTWIARGTAYAMYVCWTRACAHWL